MTPTEQVKMLREALEARASMHCPGCDDSHLPTDEESAFERMARAALAATAEPATPTGPQMDAVIKDGKFIRPTTPAPTYSADDLRKVAEAIKEAALRNGIGVLYGDLDAIIAKAVGK